MKHQAELEGRHSQAGAWEREIYRYLGTRNILALGNELELGNENSIN
jgi:hypothetical protein